MIGETFTSGLLGVATWDAITVVPGKPSIFSEPTFLVLLCFYLDYASMWLLTRTAEYSGSKDDETANKVFLVFFKYLL